VIWATVASCIAARSGMVTSLRPTGSHVLIYTYSEFRRKLVRLPAENPKRFIELMVDAFDDDGPEDA